MVERNFPLEKHLKNIEDLDSYLTSPSMRQSLLKHLSDFENFISININFYKKRLLLNQAAFVFDKIVEDYSSMDEYLNQAAGISKTNILNKV